MLKKIHIWLTVALTAMLSLAGCSDDDMPYETPANSEEQLGGNVFIRFHISINNDSRSRDIHDNTLTPGTSQEDYINNIDLLVEDADTKKLIDIVPISRDQLTTITQTEGVTIPIVAKKGQTLHIYAAVNMPDRIRQQFTLNQNSIETVYKFESANYWDMMDELIPGCAGKQATLQASPYATIPMTGQFVTMTAGNGAATSGSKAITITEGAGMSSDNPLKLNAYVSRIVAKVHVLAKTAPLPSNNPNATKYACAVAATKDNSGTPTPPETIDPDQPKDDYGYIGWIRLDSIRYIPNGISNTTYLFPHFDSSNKPIDNDMRLDGYIEGDRFNRTLWSRNYVYYNGMDMHRENISATQHLAPVEDYVQTRYEATGTPVATTSTTDDNTPYTHGMYCPENYFNAPETANTGIFNDYESSIPMITNVTIAAKLVPRKIVFRRNFVTLMDNFVKEYNTNKDAFRKKYSLTVEDFTDKDIKCWTDTIRPRYFARYASTETAGDSGGGSDTGDTGGGSDTGDTGGGSDTGDTGGGSDTGDTGGGSSDVPQTVAETTVEPEDPVIESYRDGDYCIIKTLTEEDAITVLNYSLKVTNLWSDNPNDFETGRYPAGTFFVYDTNYDSAEQKQNEEWNQRYLYMAPGAVTTADGKHARFKIYSVPHLGGWGYYYTYLDETGATTNSKTPYMASQVTRNHYYLITVDNFGVPGGSITRPEYIKVNTRSVDWVYKGRGDINLH